MNRLLILLTICTMCQSAAADIVLDPDWYEKDQVVWFGCYEDRMVYCWETGEVFELELDTGKTKFLFRVDALCPRQIYPGQSFHLSQAKQKILAVSGAPISFYDINTQKRTQCQIDNTKFLQELGFLDSTNHYVCRCSKKIWIVDAVDCQVLASFDYSGQDSGLIKISKDGDKYICSSDHSTFIKTRTGEVMWNKVHANLAGDAFEDQHGRYDVIVYHQDDNFWDPKFNVSKIFTFDTFKGKEIWSKESVSPHQLRAVSRDAQRQFFRSKDKLIIENVPLNNRVIVDTRITEVEASEVDAVFTVNGDLLLLPGNNRGQSPIK